MVLFIVKLFMQARRKEKLQKMWREWNERSPGQVCATGMYRSIEHVEFPEFQTGIVIEWKAP